MSIFGIRKWLFVTLIGILLAAWFVPAAQDGVVLSDRIDEDRPVRSAIAYEQAAPSSSSIAVLSITPRVIEKMEDPPERLFAATQWGKATEPTVAPPLTLPGLDLEPEPVPVLPDPPALPFRVLGRYQEKEQTVIFFQGINETFLVRVGEMIGEDYKLEKITDTILSLRYLPLDRVQHIQLGASFQIQGYKENEIK